MPHTDDGFLKRNGFKVHARSQLGLLSALAVHFLTLRQNTVVSSFKPALGHFFKLFSSRVVEENPGFGKEHLSTSVFENHRRLAVGMQSGIRGKSESGQRKNDGFESLTLKDLKAMLKVHSLKVSGNKAELVARLRNHSIQEQTLLSGGVAATSFNAEADRPLEARIANDDKLYCLTVKDLKAALNLHGLKISGNKKELVARLRNHLARGTQVVPAIANPSVQSPALGKRLNEDFARVLGKLAEMSSRKGELFRKKAYQKAAERVLNYPGDIVDATELQDTRHIGKSIFAKLVEYASTGTLMVLETEEGKTNRSLQAMKVRPETIYSRFQATSIPIPHVPRNQVPDGAVSFKAVAWNINGLRAFAKRRPDALPSLVRQEQPDIIGLMEHKMQEGMADTERTIENLLETIPGYEVVCLHCSRAKKGYSGTCLLRRSDAPELFSLTALDLPSAKDEGRLIVAEFETFFLVLAYVPNSGERLKRLDRRMEWDIELQAQLEDLVAKKPALLIGDLNVAHRDKDIWNSEASHVPKSPGTSPQERDSFSALLDAGFVDGFAHLHPEAMGTFTYWSVRAKNRPRNRGLRLDYAVASRSLLPSSRLAETSESGDAKQARSKPKLIDVFHLPDMSDGDHCPVGALIQL